MYVNSEVCAVNAKKIIIAQEIIIFTADNLLNNFPASAELLEQVAVDTVNFAVAPVEVVAVALAEFVPAPVVESFALLKFFERFLADLFQCQAFAVAVATVQAELRATQRLSPRLPAFQNSPK